MVRRRHKLTVWLLAAILSLAVAGAVRAGVTIVDDEVIFTLRDPGAKTVFLVGDFNNWNPTVEKMDREGDLFEVSLFLVAGDYRYKFVVDGKWTHDPDNPPNDPSLGSPLFLAEQNDMLVFKVVDAEGAPAEVSLDLGIRYIGDFRWAEDAKASAGQIVDVDVAVEAMTYSAAVTIQSLDDTWTASPFDAAIGFLDGRLDVPVNQARFAAFKSDTSWTSADPFRLFGYSGVYDIEFGYDEKGVSFELPISGAVQINAVYADRLGRETAPGADDISPDRIAALEWLAPADTSIYLTSPGFGDMDIFGFETRLAFGEYRGGYVFRMNRGMHPGLVNRFVRQDTTVLIAAFRSHEDWYAHSLWGSAELFGRVRATAGLGWSDAYLRRTRRTVGESDQLEPLDVLAGAEPWQSRSRIQNGRRIGGGLLYQARGFYSEIQAGYHREEFKPALFRPAVAECFRLAASGRLERSRWLGALHIEYTDQDYDNAPPEYHFDGSERNYWLSGHDDIRPARLAVLAHPTYMILRGVWAWNPRNFISGGAFNFYQGWPAGTDASGTVLEHREEGRSLMAEFGLAAGGLAEDVEFGFLRLFVEQPLRKSFYLQADGRGAVYDIEAWDNHRRTFISTYVEAGYRAGWMELSAGFGFDPVILDPSRNVYYDIGRVQYLRESLAGGINWISSVEPGRELLELEQRMDLDRTLKIECILSF